MEDRKPVDISEERYDGPSAAIIAAGRGLFQHLIWAAIGVGAGFTAAYVAPDKAEKLIQFMRRQGDHLVTENKGFLNSTKNWLGETIFGILGEGSSRITEIKSGTDARHLTWNHETLVNKQHGFGHWFTTHTTMVMPFIGKPIREWIVGWQSKRAINALTIGGAFGAAGYVGGWLEAIFHGSRHGSDGRLQLEAAQDALKKEYMTSDALAAQNTRLAEENAALKAKFARQPRPGMSVEDGLADAREPIKAPEHDWAQSVKSDRLEAAQQEAALS